MGIMEELKKDFAAAGTKDHAARKAELVAQRDALKAEIGLDKGIRMSKFSEAVEDGRCPKCGGTTFRAKRSGFGKGLGAIFGGVGILFAPKSQVRCEGCGKTFRRG